MTGRRHDGTFEVISRDALGRATSWRAACGRHWHWDGPDYAAVEDEWRRHVHAETGAWPADTGKQAGTGDAVTGQKETPR